ncbi:Two-component response regulator [Rhodovulum sp. P5]|uniref:response regulator n=1 Tax=Rhodovulum sp. P5 TaxID=1564506 RepID=UPI0009C1C0EF|nr:response regulator [Rhodovulum sp. P5]ARE40995.1 Two-component response regulator [Rhodovulum sp. P5]
MARVLIADDDADYRAAFSKGLNALGHEVDAVSEGAQVEKAVTEADRPYDILFLDVMMPAGGAATVLHRMTVIVPDLPVVIITGRAEVADSPLFKHGMRLARARVRKTADLKELDALVRSLTAE